MKPNYLSELRTLNRDYATRRERMLFAQDRWYRRLLRWLARKIK